MKNVEGRVSSVCEALGLVVELRDVFVRVSGRVVVMVLLSITYFCLLFHIVLLFW